MSTVERIRKQIYKLTAEDLKRRPLWEFCPDEEGEEGQDEATVKPSEGHEVPGYSPGAYILACDVTFADGSTSMGYVSSGDPSDFGCTQPTILTASGHINLWLGWLKFVKSPQDQIARAFEMLDRGSTAVFPVRFITRPNISGAPMELVAASFMARSADQKITERSFVAVPA